MIELQNNVRSLTRRIPRVTAAVCIAALAACGQGSPDKLMASARDYLAKGDRGAAVIQLKNLLQEHPDHGEARFLLGQTQFDSRDFASAEKELRRSLELGQPEEKVVPLLAQALLELGQDDKLVKEFGERKLADAQAEAALKTRVGEAQMKRGRLPQARTAFDAAQAAVPGYARARLGVATLAAIEGKPDEAMRLADEVLAADPKLAAAHLLRADLLLAKGDRAAAKKALENAIGADPRLLQPRLGIVTLLIDEKDFDQAQAQLAEARKIDARDPRVTYADALLSFRRGDANKARDQIAQVLKIYPDHVPSLVLGGAIAMQLKELASAETNLRRAVGLAPNHVGARRLLVATLLRMGQPAAAKDTLQPLVESGMPRDPQLLLLAGETFLANGDVQRATTFYQLASAQADPEQGVSAKTRLGQIALASGNVDQGFKELEAASELDEKNYQADLALITAHLRRREFDQALAAVRSLEKKQPRNPLTFQMYGIVQLAKRDNAAARKSFETALQLQANYLPAARNLALLDLSEKKPEDARKRYEAMIAQNPKDDSLVLALAELQVRMGADPKEVVPTLMRAVEANPLSVQARIALTRSYIATRDFKAALAAAQSAAAVIPDDPRIVESLGVALEASGDLNQAIDAYNRVATMVPKSPQPWLRIAALHARRKETDKAADALRRAQKLVPNPREVVPQLVQVLLAGDRADEALREVRELQKREPKFAGGWALEGDVLASQRKYAEAEKAYREALKLEPKANVIAIRLHGVLGSAGKSAEAEALAKKWLADNPRDGGMRLYLAERELTARNYKAAAAQYQSLLSLEPNNAVVLNNLAWALGELGDARAVGYAERAVAAAPNNAMALDTLGMLLAKKGETDKALTHLEQARKLAPERYDIRLNFARTLAKAGRKDAARKELQELQAVQADFPGKSDIPELLKSL